MIQHIGIITGVAEEAEAFCADMPGAVVAAHGLSFRQIELADKRISIVCCGVGKVNAAMAATLLAAHYNVDLLMIIGTAGKLSSINGDCFIIHEAVQGDFGAQRPEGFTHYTAGSWPIGPAQVEAFAAFPLPEIGLPKARIITGDSFVECPDHSQRLANALTGDLVDMETAALAQVAERLGLPWAAIKATTDEANGGSAGDFQTNLRRAAHAAANAAERAILALH